ncbi:MAG: M6 family metalloprotease domain-containing protein [Candidatus Krumholzibacteria bacterium]|nr:M6 family metalloprotease domain-containing protein [Candidatus Krumholzibacteria bacterium]
MKSITSLCVIILFVFSAACYAQIVPPKPGVDMPRAYFERIANDKTAFRFQHAWIQKAERAKKARQQFLAGRHDGPAALSSLPEQLRKSMLVSGTARVPVFVAQYANTGSAPYPVSDLQQELFDGPWSTGTMTELYTEMSNGNITLTGTVYDWVSLSENDTYYEGGCNGLCSSGKTGQFILEILQAQDPSVDFGQYDNDGPDGVANSGDDDGYVDFVAFVHPEKGGECATDNLWSHRWVVNAWPEFPSSWQTNDSRAGGGYIQIKDYVIQPALSCSGSMIEIGVFAHEFGHAFGLPDLYDTDGGGQGIGHHGLMGSGNWNTPENPAHMSPWSKLELGWVTPIEIGGVEQSYTIDNINQSGEVYQLNIMEEKFSRQNVNPIAGSYSLRCGITNAQANNRNWPGSGGYGNDWTESMRKDFTYDGNNPITLQYDVSYDTEANFDWGRIKIKVNGTVSTVRSYTGIGSANNVSVDLTPYLNGSGATEYQLIAEFTSDYAFADEDGDYDSGNGGPFKLDNISVSGGGENYSTDFEQYEDGWYCDFTANPHREFFLVENRSTAGQFDQGLHAEGLFIWHIEQNVMGSRYKNTGGGSGTATLLPAGVMMEEADGLRHLLLGTNRGDAGDVCPGSTGSRTFDSTTTPGSFGHNGDATNVSVSNVSDPAPQMTATMRAGWYAPALSAITPNSGGVGELVSITDLAGSELVHGTTFLIRDGSMVEYAATNLQWIGKTKLIGDLDLSGVPAGSYDVVARLPDGQEAILAGSFEVAGSVAVLIQSVNAQVQGMSVVITWQIVSDETILGYHVLRREIGEVDSEIINPSLIASDERRFVDEGVLLDNRYEYVLLVVLGNGSELRSQPVTARTASLALELLQNDPNPFNPSTRIRFLLPNRTRAGLSIYDTSGRRVVTLIDEVLGAGANEVYWDGTNATGAKVASGVYYYRLQAENRVLTKKLLLLK